MANDTNDTDGIYILPDNTIYQIPVSAWQAARAFIDNWPQWIKNNPTDASKLGLPETLPLYTKISRSGKKLYIEMPGKDAPILLPETVNVNIQHSFILEPLSKDDQTPVLWALQKEEDKKKYFMHKPAANTTEESSRVKWEFPDPVYVTSHELQPGIYKTETYYDGEDLPPNIGLNKHTYIRKSKNGKLKRVSHMEYLGPNVFDVLKDKETLPLSAEIWDMAKQCCQLVKNLHDQQILLIDIKPTNFAYLNKKVAILDDAAIESIEHIENSKTYKVNQPCSETYLAPECKKKGVADADLRKNLTIQSDIYALGRTYEAMAIFVSEDETKKKLLLMSRIMQQRDPKQRPTAEQVLALFKCSLFEMEALDWLSQNFPHLLSLENIRKLFKEDTGPLLVCTILGVKEYLAAAKRGGGLTHGQEGKKAVKDLIKDLLEASETTESEITNKITQCTTSYAPSRHQIHSRSTILNKYKAINNRNLMPEQQKLMLKLDKFFPKHHTEWEKIIDNPLLFCVIKKSIEYMEHSQAGWHGKRAVQTLVRTLLSESFNVANKDAVEAEITACHQGSRHMFSCFYSVKSSQKEGSRARMITLDDEDIKPGV